MPALAALTINDGQATPVAHIFSPVRLDDKGVATFFDRSGGIAIGFPRLTFSMREPNGNVQAGSASDKRRNYKSILTIDVPTMESTSAATGTGIAPAPTVAHVHSARNEFLLPERGTAAERKNLFAYVTNSIGNATIAAALQNLEAFY